MKKLLVTLAVFCLLGSAASAQNILRNLGQRAKNAVEQNVGQKVEKGVNDVLDGKMGKKDKKENQEVNQEEEAPVAVKADAAWTCPECGAEGNTGKFCAECGAKKPGTEVAKPKKQIASNYAKSDFVPGDEIIFEDNLENEQLGEFPSRWDLMDGYAETGEVDGRKVISFTDNGFGQVQPLMKDQKHFLSDVFTLEFDVFVKNAEEDEDLGEQTIELTFGNPDVDNHNGGVGWITFWNRSNDSGARMMWAFQKPNGGDDVGGDKNLSFDEDTPLVEGWNHLAFSFNKRAFKGYVNGLRIINIPSAKVPTHFWINHGGAYTYGCISNIRVAKGAVPLYDRLTSEGKIITYAITFETGKADIKPESYVEINRIAKLMEENPGLEFEVQGHCDATGSDKVNDPLSQKRAEAIVAALVEQGIASARLTPVGKGSHVPIASNSTDEGRAKNRRVEFVKK
jgi:outer membrane protein OmpA-like peptidoglycan-associated protein